MHAGAFLICCSCMRVHGDRQGLLHACVSTAISCYVPASPYILHFCILLTQLYFMIVGILSPIHHTYGIIISHAVSTFAVPINHPSTCSSHIHMLMLLYLPPHPIKDRTGQRMLGRIRQQHALGSHMHEDDKEIEVGKLPACYPNVYMRSCGLQQSGPFRAFT